jgi:hypothetical protein
VEGGNEEVGPFVFVTPFCDGDVVLLGVRWLAFAAAVGTLNVVPVVED